MNERSDDGDGAAFSTDPFAAISSVQHHAVEQATAIFGRLLRAFDQRRVDDPLETMDDSEPNASFAQLRAAVGRTMDLYVELFQRTFESYLEMIETTMRRRGVSVTGSTEAGAAELVLDRVDDGASVHGTLFVHNFSGAAAGPVTVRLSDLCAHDGAKIAGSDVDVEPPSLETVADGTTAQFDIGIDIALARPGTYHGHAFAGEGVLPVRVVVPERRHDDDD
jgi:hypothetical protein